MKKFVFGLVSDSVRVWSQREIILATQGLRQEDPKFKDSSLPVSSSLAQVPQRESVSLLQNNKQLKWQGSCSARLKPETLPQHRQYSKSAKMKSRKGGLENQRSEPLSRPTPYTNEQKQRGKNSDVLPTVNSSTELSSPSKYTVIYNSLQGCLTISQHT